jgi:hypothetical protein
MGISTSYFAADLAGMIDDIPATFVLGALSFSCSATDLEDDQTLLMTGFDSKAAISVIFPVSAVATSATALYPSLRIGVIRPGNSVKNYQVNRINRSQDNVSYTLICMEDNRS